MNVIKPICPEIFEITANAEKIYFLEEGMRSGGAGEGFALSLLERGFKGEFRLVSVEDEFVSQASVGSQLEKYGLDENSILKMLSEE